MNIRPSKTCEINKKCALRQILNFDKSQLWTNIGMSEKYKLELIKNTSYRATTLLICVKSRTLDQLD